MTTLEKSIQQKIDTWLQGNFHIDTKNTLQKMLQEGKIDALQDAFYKDLTFGTGGLRGIMGVGTKRMNRYTVGLATQGLSNYLQQCFPDQRIQVAIAYDSRHQSKAFAQIVADVFSANGCQVYLFKALRPTPELSFAIRHLRCHSGVVITASHNPKEYNGYKAYWTDGAQLVAPHDQRVIEAISKISLEEVNFIAQPENITLIGEEIDELYLQKILQLSISKEAIRQQKDLKIVYTPLHGTGITLIPPLLSKMGFEQVTVVKEQAEPSGNGDFPTVVYPNPEEAEALSLALEKARHLEADLVMATDPDTDRVGIAVKNHQGAFQLLNGNQTGSLLFYYLLAARQKAGQLTGDEYVVKTIVTTDLMDQIAADYGVDCYHTLTGFKHIAAVIRQLEGKKTFVAGAEESYGYMVGDFVRDKDGVAACAMIAELSAFAKAQQQSLFDLLLDLYLKYGYYYETLFSLTKKGQEGAEAIQQMMQRFRTHPPRQLGGLEVVRLRDYQSLTEHHLTEGTITPLDFQDKSNVLQFFTAEGSKISVRPSGTEPKIKFYVSLKEALPQKSAYDAVTAKLQQKIAAIKQDLL
ncbi:MAG: phospho-sugar mutase [Thermonemataceae bacterium]